MYIYMVRYSMHVEFKDVHHRNCIYLVAVQEPGEKRLEPERLAKRSSRPTSSVWHG